MLSAVAGLRSSPSSASSSQPARSFGQRRTNASGRDTQSRQSVSPSASTVPHWPGSNTNSGSSSSVRSRCAWNVSTFAPVGESTSMREAFSRTASHTSPCATPRPSAADWSVAALRRRSSGLAACGKAANADGDRRHRPSSTQETGIGSVDFASARRSHLTTRLLWLFDGFAAAHARGERSWGPESSKSHR
jgi:hypothetical protein